MYSHYCVLYGNPKDKLALNSRFYRETSPRNLSTNPVNTEKELRSIGICKFRTPVFRKELAFVGEIYVQHSLTSHSRASLISR